MKSWSHSSPFYMALLLNFSGRSTFSISSWVKSVTWFLFHWRQHNKFGELWKPYIPGVIWMWCFVLYTIGNINHGKNVLGHLSRFFLFIVPRAREMNADIYTFCTWRSSLYGNYITQLPHQTMLRDVACGLKTWSRSTLYKGEKGDDFNWWL